MAHYIVVTDTKIEGDAILQVAEYINSVQDEYPDISFRMTGALHRASKQWFPPTVTEVDAFYHPFNEQDVQNQMLEILSTSPFGTTDEDVIRALESRHKPELKLAYNHMQWLYTTAGVTDSNLDIWCDSILENELTSPGITNLTTEYESDPVTTFMVAIEATVTSESE